MTGRIKSVQYAYAFVISDEEPDTPRFFYRDDIINDRRLALYDLTRILVPGLLVDFTPVLHDKGPRAIPVRLLGNTPGNHPAQSSNGSNGNTPGHTSSP
jgi:hypothetical protein